MADIQHRDIPDGERHDIKGASTAIAGSVPVSTGAGSTSFQKIGVNSLNGSLPPNQAGLQVITDGAGGFIGNSGAYGTFDYTKPSTPGGVGTLVQAFVPQGMYVDGDTVHITDSGFYLFTSNSISYESALDQSLKWPKLVFNTGAILTGAPYGVINLLAGTRVRLDGTGNFSLAKVSV